MSHKNGKKKVEILNSPSTGLCVEKLPLQSFNPSTDITPLGSLDGQKLQEMVDLNNTFAALDKQKKQYEGKIFQFKIEREKIQKGEISMPVMLHISPVLSYVELKKEVVLKKYDDIIKNLELARQGIIGTLEHRRDEFMECKIRVIRLLGGEVKGYEIKNISGVRSKDKSIEEDEKKAIEKEFEKMLQSNKVE
jgi:hypothetical protein